MLTRLREWWKYQRAVARLMHEATDRGESLQPGQLEHIQTSARRPG